MPSNPERAKAVGFKLRQKLDERETESKPKAKTGYYRPDATFSIKGDPAHKDTLGVNQIWATHEDGRPIIVFAPDFTQTKSVDIRVYQVVPGAPWQVWGPDVVRGTQALGELLWSATQPPVRDDQNADRLIGSINFLPGRLYSVDGGRTVNLARFSYLDSAGHDAIWQPDDDPTSAGYNALTLVPPPQISGVDQRGYQRIWFNHAAGAPALGQTAGAPIAATLPVTNEMADAIVMPDGMEAFWDINLATADTTLPAIRFVAPFSWIDRRKFYLAGSIATATKASDLSTRYEPMVTVVAGVPQIVFAGGDIVMVEIPN